MAARRSLFAHLDRQRWNRLSSDWPAWQDDQMTSNAESVPLLEFDPSRAAFVEPVAAQGCPDAPLAAVACFFPEIVAELAKGGHAVADLTSREPLWEIDYQGRKLGIFYPGVGAPLAASTLERVIAAGCRTIIACGGAGALVPQLSMGHHVITVTSAIRDEGTSFHYVPPSREIVVDIHVVSTMSNLVIERGLPHMAGKTWTTDALYRETSARVARRQAEGCLTVEMEASAMISVAAFRDVQFGQYLYAADDLSGDIWDDRDWREAADVRWLLVNLAAQAALTLAPDQLQQAADRSTSPCGAD
jgi:uridine phosphorylase